jgi:Tol biopolymer transport system component
VKSTEETRRHRAVARSSRSKGIAAALAMFGIGASPGLASAQVATTRASVDSAGVEGDDGTWDAVVSADGQVVAFTSSADNLVPGDTNFASDVFVRDLTTGITTRVSVDSAGAEANGTSRSPAISADGAVVAFWSDANDLVAGDTNGKSDVFVHDLQTGVTTRVSVSSAGAQGNGMTWTLALSADRRFVAFSSSASNLVAGDTNNAKDVFVHDRATGITTRESVATSGAGANGNCGDNGVAISGDGMVVAFASWATNLVAGDANNERDIFVRDRAAGTTTRVSVSTAGVEGDSFSEMPAISADGNVVSFMSLADNLVAGDTNGGGGPDTGADIFVHDRSTGETTRVSVDSSGAEQGDAYIDHSALSSDGSIVAFMSSAFDLVAGDTNNSLDIFVHDRTTGITQRVSVSSSGTESNNSSYFTPGALSGDGQVVVFTSDADNLVPSDLNSQSDAFVHGYPYALASWANYGTGLPGTLGIPTFTSRDDPVIGTTIRLDLANSRGVQTPGLLFVGGSAGSMKFKGGTLLVDDVLILVQLGVAAGGMTIDVDVPNDLTLVGAAAYVQVMELDPGAVKGFSFTPGIELDLGF